ncbi:hypothetical protein CH063_14838 [Colletotrichum higginsianum]|uniref:Uncharacterized protein n=1 Tax=Colletotrichum higginsianum (strain IMI 349063) TaxID=759273 RepID=H1W0A3_COLHI|nr:hypothetical protein CH063_14838 [Colletotrichum higginsianum]
MVGFGGEHKRVSGPRSLHVSVSPTSFQGRRRAHRRTEGEDDHGTTEENCDKNPNKHGYMTWVKLQKTASKESLRIIIHI